ncbi:MAG: hypothetical protein K0V04_02530 [Deltaproteobacteria bacterium]|nr:hypothetical protein [Deltaproteobacteria bacterium]
MTDTSAILEVRHVHLAEQATIEPATLPSGEDGVFVALDEPPPVRTVLTVVNGDERRPLAVVAVVEVTHGDQPQRRGLYGQWVDDQALASANRVGTEHLEDGMPVVQPVMPDNSRALPLSDVPTMAMPAPVVMLDGDDDSREDADEAHDLEPSAAPGEAEAEAVAAEGSAEAETTEAEAAESGAETETTEAVVAEGGDETVPAQTEASEAAAADDASPQADAPSEAPTSEDNANESSSNNRRSRGGKKKRGRRRR